MNIFVKLKALLQLRKAISMANAAYSERPQRYYIVPSLDARGKRQLVIVDKRNFRKLRAKHYIPAEANMNSLFVECVYCTPHANGSGALTKEMIDDKRKMYLDWVALYSKRKRKA